MEALDLREHETYDEHYPSELKERAVRLVLAAESEPGGRQGTQRDSSRQLSQTKKTLRKLWALIGNLAPIGLSDPLRSEWQPRPLGIVSGFEHLQ